MLLSRSVPDYSSPIFSQTHTYFPCPADFYCVILWLEVGSGMKISKTQQFPRIQMWPGFLTKICCASLIVPWKRVCSMKQLRGESERENHHSDSGRSANCEADLYGQLLRKNS